SELPLAIGQAYQMIENYDASLSAIAESLVMYCGEVVAAKETYMASKGKTVIVTGASQGIGAGVVEAFLDRGYNVVANSRNIIKSGAFAASEKVALVDGD